MEKRDISKRANANKTLVIMLLLMLIGYVLIHDLLGGTLFSHSAWDSYTLQAMAWRNGSAALEENYSWLELAIYNGNYYVSFPPFPSVIMLPLTFVFGVNTPNNAVVMLLCMGAAALAYRALTFRGMKETHAALLALLCTWGSNLMWMSTNGGVWFMAQAMNMCLLMGALYSAMREKRVLAYALVAMAVGCRPFSAFAFLPLFAYFYKKDRAYGFGFVKTAFLQLRNFIIPALIAAAYMAYNYIRFDNVLEFGHNYLPEFLESENGQFSLTYIGENLYNLFIRPIWFKDALALDYPLFNGFMFYVANPLFIVFFVSVYKDIRRKRFDAVRIAIIAAMILNILMTCAHKTLGGWQFGARYTVDMIPLALGFIMLDKHKFELKPYEHFIAFFGIMLNVYGALAMNFLYS